jgi:hypothetical protein
MVPRRVRVPPADAQTPSDGLGRRGIARYNPPQGFVIRLKRLFQRLLLTLVAISIAYLVLLAYPQPLFAYELTSDGITVHSTGPIPDAMKTTLARARARLDRSPLGVEARMAHVFICQSRWVFALFARQNYRVAGVADWLVGQHVFLRESDMENDRLIGPSGRPVSADRPLSYFIAHELMHVANVRTVGRWKYARQPQWVDDGYADYIARDIDLGDALKKMKEDARELDPPRSGLYLRYHLLVAYWLDKRRMPLDGLLNAPPLREDIEAQLSSLPIW